MLSQKIPWYYSLPAIILSTLLSVILIYAWQEPSAPPPGGNVPAPINVGDSTQYKAGALGIGGILQSFGPFVLPRLNTTQRNALSPTSGMMIYNVDTNEIQLYGTTTWNAITGASVKLGLGESCSSNGSCDSDHCVDGVCCDNACNGDCVACNITGSIGTCANLSSGTVDTCTGAYTCSGFTTRLRNVCNGSGSCADIDAAASDCSGTCASYCSGGSCISTDTGAGTCIVSTNVRVSSGGDGRCNSGTCNPPLTWSGSTHYLSDCTALGGTSFDTGDTGTICKYPGATVPSGWIQAENWQRYSVGSWGGDICGRHLSTAPTTFSNTISYLRECCGAYHTNYGCESDWGSWHHTNGNNYIVITTSNSSTNRIEIGIY